MDFLIERITESLDERLVRITISNPRRSEEVKKYGLRPILIKDKLQFQMEAYTKTQVFHENLEKEQTIGRLREILPLYKQVQVQTTDGDFTALINKKGKAAVKITGRKKQDVMLEKSVGSKAGKIGEKAETAALIQEDRQRLMHNRKKKYILQEGQDIPFLRDLGVMTADGKILRQRYDKFRQINRFLEFIEDILPHLSSEREITILDFGCGKSYLTFAVYYYLKVLKNYNIRIIGLDLKKDVIQKCASLAAKYGYDKLHFYEGSIEEFEGVTKVDMVITLHACDTATDYALYKAVRWDADVILSVPCCQHELNGQLKTQDFGPIVDYGILKERFAALATDGIRADLLESMGYHTQILEFIDMEHTPKNLLIRATKGKMPSDKKWKETVEFCDSFGFHPTLKELLDKERMRKNEGYN